MTDRPPPLYEQPWPEGEFRFFQIGHVVHDVVAAARTWSRTFGVGPFHVLPITEQRLSHGADDLRTIRLQIAVAQAGPVQIELIQQHCDTPSIYRDWSRGGTSSFHQLATVTSHYDEKKRHYESLGYPIVAESRDTGFRIAYVDTLRAFGFYTEVVELKPGFLEQLDAISKTCATWDGTDPVRLLRRGGYRVPE